MAMFLKRGEFQNDEMKGIWKYYDWSGHLKAQFNCVNEAEITPYLIIDNSGDTLLKNGNGHFIFNTIKDLPPIFPFSVFNTIEGQVVNGKKDGEFNYWYGLQNDKDKILYTETYKNGIFEKLKTQRGKYSRISTNKPLRLLDLSLKDHLHLADNFSHSNIIFDGQEGANKVIQLLVYGKIPELAVNSKSYRDNLKVIFYILGAVLRKSLLPDYATNVSYSYPPGGLSTNIVSFSKMLDASYRPKNIRFSATFSLDTTGYFSNSTFKGNIENEVVKKINYYLSRMSGLANVKKNGIPVTSDISVKCLSIVDTLTDKNLQPLVNCRYLAFSSDSTDESMLDEDSINRKIEYEARPVGGASALEMYIKTQLNTYVPISHNAPNDTYEVEVIFKVNEDGTISDVKTKNDPGFGTKEEAIRVIKFMPDWIPARKDGKPVPFIGHKKIKFYVQHD